MMRRSPAFTAIAVLTLALGSGANTAIFSVVDALLLRPLPLAQPDRLVLISASNPGQVGAGGPFSLIAYDHLREHNQTFDGVATYTAEGYSLTGSGDPEQLQGARVAPDFFDVLQARPITGRTFTSTEGDAGGPPVAVISQGLWQRRFGSNPAVVGQSITLSQEAYTIIGVMPAGFPFPFPATDIWTTRLMNYSALTADQIHHGAGYLVAVGRLKRGIAESQAVAEIAILDRQYRREHPGNPDADPHGNLEVTPLQESLVTGIRPTLLILTGAVGLVLLIACANVASLMLAKATARGREMAIRSALGAGRATLIRQLLAEGILLATMGALLGVLLAVVSVPALAEASRANLPGFQPIRVDLRVLAFTLEVSLLTGVGFGLIPALQASSPDLNGVLRDSGWGTTTGGRRHRARSILVVGQLALSIVLLIGAGLLVQSFQRLQNVNPGFNPRNALTMQVTLPQPSYPDNVRRSQFARETMARIQAMPGVTSVSASSGLPLASNLFAPFIAEGQPVVAISQRPLANWNGISPDYFKTLGIPLLRGRDFSWSDDEKAPPRVIVSQTLAQRYWPNENPIGRHLTYARREVVAEIIGVASDVKGRSLDTDAGLIFYTPYSQFAWPGISLTVRTAGDPHAFFRTVPAQIFAQDRNLPVVNIQTTEDLVNQTVSQQRQTVYVITGFAAVALLLAMIGIYGAMAYSVAQRTMELGIRQAIGAQRSDVLGMILAQGLRLAVGGIVLGVIAAAVFTRLLSGLLFHVSATDPLTYGGVCALLLVVSLAASCLPAWRAARVDPLEALRAR